jgi:hypothetical protein
MLCERLLAAESSARVKLIDFRRLRTSSPMLASTEAVGHLLGVGQEISGAAVTGLSVLSGTAGIRVVLEGEPLPFPIGVDATIT